MVILDDHAPELRGIEPGLVVSELDGQPLILDAAGPGLWRVRHRGLDSEALPSSRFGTIFVCRMHGHYDGRIVEFVALESGSLRSSDGHLVPAPEVAGLTATFEPIS